MSHATTDIDTLLSRARVRLLLDQPFFGTLLMRLRTKITDSVATFATNGTHLYVNGAFAASLPEKQLIGVLAHETMHCALGHVWRRGSRDAKRWNIAADYVINEQLLKSGFELPPDALVDSQFDGMSAEQVYSKLAADDSGGNPQDPQLSTGEFTDAPQPEPNTPPEDAPLTETDWQIATEQAIKVAAKAGQVPGNMAQTIKETRKPMTDWRAELKDFVLHTMPSDYSWTHPNRRYIANGLYLPGIVRENTGPLVVAMDTSGSVDDDMRNQFAANLTAILHETRPESLIVLYCDTRVNGTAEFTPDDPEVTLEPKGGGGTRFQPVFDYVVEHQLAPTALIYLTDLESFDAPVEPADYPVLWATPEHCTLPPPFGRVVRLSAYQ